MKAALALVFALVAVCCAEVYFQEDFNDGNWQDRWVLSSHKEAEGTAGEFEMSHGKFYADEDDVGLQTSQDARFYQVSAALEEFSNKDNTLVLQYSVKHEQNIDCGGGYVKLLPKGLDQEDFNGDSEYNIMFGPDICGSTKRTHVIITYKGKNHLIKDQVKCESDELSHLYTLVLKPDQTYKVLIDNEVVREGSLTKDWSFLPPKKIKDPSASKPKDWVDEAEIPDPEAVKPDDWDDVAPEIPDPDAEEPDDWDEELDGKWEPPMIENPDYRGEWEPPMIKNPEYKGAWKHPMIPNPDYYTDSEIYAFDSHAFLGIEIWQVKSGTIFDDFLVTDSEDEADEAAKAFLEKQAAEKEAYEEEEERRRAEAAAAREEEEEADDSEDEEDEEEFDADDFEPLAEAEDDDDDEAEDEDEDEDKDEL